MVETLEINIDHTINIRFGHVHSGLCGVSQQHQPLSVPDVTYPSTIHNPGIIDDDIHLSKVLDGLIERGLP
jgi:hypothetical protein